MYTRSAGGRRSRGSCRDPVSRVMNNPEDNRPPATIRARLVGSRRGRHRQEQPAGIERSRRSCRPRRVATNRTSIERAACSERLYEKRKAVHNKRIDGPFRRFKWLVMLVTLAIYYVTPWIRWDRGPYAPDQAVLVDLANRALLHLQHRDLAARVLFRRRAADHGRDRPVPRHQRVGRAWCGYACPQTVWTDLFQHVDRWIDGDRNARIRLDRAPMDLGKLRARLQMEHLPVIAFWTGGAWISTSPMRPRLSVDSSTGEAAPVAYSRSRS